MKIGWLNNPNIMPLDNPDYERPWPPRLPLPGEIPYLDQLDFERLDIALADFTERGVDLVVISGNVLANVSSDLRAAWMETIMNRIRSWTRAHVWALCSYGVTDYDRAPAAAIITYDLWIESTKRFLPEDAGWNAVNSFGRDFAGIRCLFSNIPSIYVSPSSSSTRSENVVIKAKTMAWLEEELTHTTLPVAIFNAWSRLDYNTHPDLVGLLNVHKDKILGLFGGWSGTGCYNLGGFTQMNINRLNKLWTTDPPGGGDLASRAVLTLENGEITLDASGSAALSDTYLGRDIDYPSKFVAGVDETHKNTAYGPSSDYHGYKARWYNYLGKGLPLRILLPKNYDPAVKYPVVFGSHGSPSTGNDNLKHIANSWNFGGCHYPDSAYSDTYDTTDFISVCVQATSYWDYNDDGFRGSTIPEPFFGRPEYLPATERFGIDEHHGWQQVHPLSFNLSALEALLNDIEFGNLELFTDDKFNGEDAALAEQIQGSMNLDRLYATGFSLGGMFSWAVARRMFYRWAAIMPVDGATYKNISSVENSGIQAEWFLRTQATVFEHIPIVSVTGSRVDLGGSTRITTDAMFAAGRSNLWDINSFYKPEDPEVASQHPHGWQIGNLAWGGKYYAQYKIEEPKIAWIDIRETKPIAEFALERPSEHHMTPLELMLTFTRQEVSGQSMYENYLTLTEDKLLAFHKAQVFISESTSKIKVFATTQEFWLNDFGTVYHITKDEDGWAGFESIPNRRITIKDEYIILYPKNRSTILC